MIFVEYLITIFWTFVGLIFWFPLLSRVIIVVIARVIFDSITYRPMNTVQIRKVISYAACFYLEGFKLISNRIGSSQPAENYSETIEKTGTFRKVILDILWALLFWTLIFFPVIKNKLAPNLLNQLSITKQESLIVDHQSTSDFFDRNKIYSKDELNVNPSFPNGYLAEQKWIKNNIKNPKLAIENNISGVVYIKFIVTVDGKIDSPEVYRGIGGGCEEEVLTKVKKMPQWNPGKIAGEYVNSYYIFEVKFPIKN